MDYRRNKQPGVSYFFTLVTYQRQSLLTQNNIERLRQAFKREMQKRPFTIDAIVILPGHPHYYKKHQQGFSLLEMMIVVFILSLIAAVAIPNLSVTETYKLDIAARKIVEATRFARAEAIRTGNVHGITFSNTGDNAKVYQLISGTPTYNIYHPVDKKLYTFNLKTDPATTGVEVQSYSIEYEDVSGNKNLVDFNSYGNPKYFESGSDHMLSATATITLSYAGQTRVISVSPMTGRVTVQ